MPARRWCSDHRERGASSPTTTPTIPVIFDTPTWVEVGLNASHMAGPHHVLFEGNYSQNFDSDYTHGNATYLTVFRNSLSGQRRSFTDGGNIRTVGLAYGSWWDTFIGNVLGRPGKM